MLSNHVALRPKQADDESFIYSSWLRSYRSSPIVTHMNNDVYYDNHKLVIKKLLEISDVMIACNPEDPDQIYGFICYEPGIIHYLYVKYPFRKMGLAKYLLSSIPSDATKIIITHLTSSVKSRLNDEMIYNPYILKG